MEKTIEQMNHLELVSFLRKHVHPSMYQATIRNKPTEGLRKLAQYHADQEDEETLTHDKRWEEADQRDQSFTNNE
jgi:hypothetical protein